MLSWRTGGCEDEHLVVCFQCGAANTPGNTSCHSCGAQLPASDPEAHAEAPEGRSVTCIHCGGSNVEGTAECVHCQAQLPMLDDATRNHSSSSVTGLYESFCNGCERARQGQWSTAEFRDWLVAIRAKFDQRKDAYVETVRESDYYYVQEEEVNLCMTGVFEYEEAMDALSNFAESGDLTMLDQALQTMWEANEKINDSMRLNREHRRRLEEEWGYM